MHAAQAREFEFTQEDFEFLRSLSNAKTGIVVNDDKYSMFYSRLSRRLRVLGLPDFRAYCDYLRSPRGRGEINELVNAITTNLTAFFRENHHFEFLAETAIPELLVKNRHERRIRIWSAGCSTGEEPYSLAMTLRENVPKSSVWDVSVKATDIDSNALAHAEQGVYQLDSVEGIARQRLRRFFLKGTGRKSGKARVGTALRGTVEFSQLNLMKQWRVHDVDIIFCRNVIIYFDKLTKERLIARFAESLPLGGYLFIGHSETLYKSTDRFEPIGSTIYRRVR